MHVEGRGCMSRVEGHDLRVRKSRRESKVKGQNIRVCMFFIVLRNEVYLFRQKSLFTGCCNTQSLDNCICV